MIEELKPKPMSMYKDIPNKEDCVEIARKGFAPKGKYCDNCIHFHIDLEARINPWNEQVERAVEVAKCKFFGDLLTSEKDKAPCGQTFDRYKKCVSCYLQTDKDCIELSNKLGEPLEKVITTIFVSNLIESMKDKGNDND